jgi:hypothetical protein
LPQHFSPVVLPAGTRSSLHASRALNDADRLIPVRRGATIVQKSAENAPRQWIGLRPMKGNGIKFDRQKDALLNSVGVIGVGDDP